MEKFTLKGNANSPSTFWKLGFNASLRDKQFWYSRKYCLKSGPMDYTNGYAEGNITSFWRWNTYWKETLKGRDN